MRLTYKVMLMAALFFFTQKFAITMESLKGWMKDHTNFILVGLLATGFILSTVYASESHFYNPFRPSKGRTGKAVSWKKPPKNGKVSNRKKGGFGNRKRMRGLAAARSLRL
jgi:hypothetical protein